MASLHSTVVALKGALKSNNITYSQVSEALGLNETSVKRLMSGQTPMTLDRLDQICEIAGINSLELFRIAKPSSKIEPDLLLAEQEQALADSEDLFLSFYSLAKGLSFRDILGKYRINESRLQKALHRLDKLNLIELLPENRIKFKVPRSVRWLENGPLSRKFESQLQTDFLDDPFSQAEGWRKFATFPLSERSRAQFIRKFRELIAEMQSQSEMDIILDKNLKSTATVLIGLRQWTPRLLAKFLK